MNSETVTFDNIPLIIFSKNGESDIIDIQLKEAATYAEEASQPFVLLMGREDVQW